MLIKIKCSIKELNVFHKFKNTYIILWSNQFKNIYKLSHENNNLSLKSYINEDLPFGMVFGVYGESGKNTHNIGCFVLDMSKIKSEKNYSFVSDIKDHTCNPSVTGNAHINICVQYDSPLKEINWNNKKMMNIVHVAAEKNLTWIEPYSSIGFPPINNALYKIHSPYYTTNIGVTLPSGAFCIKKTNYNEETYKKSLVSNYSRFKIALQLCNGMTTDVFVKYAEKIIQEPLEQKNKWIYEHMAQIIYTTLTMHCLHNLNYVGDYQYTKNGKQYTDRWETPREPGHSYVGDCEDCSKEIYLEYYEWLYMKTSKTEIVTFQKLLKYFVPFIVQGAVQNSSYKISTRTNNKKFLNHVWAALVPKHIVKQLLKQDINIEKDPYTVKNNFKTILLEGTGNVFPIKITKTKNKQIQRQRRMIERNIPELKFLSKCDYNTSGFYHYAVAMMSDYFWKEHGILDYTIVKDYKYGVNFDDWWSGNYVLKPNMRHDKHSKDLIHSILEYDKPIEPITYKSSINMTNNISTYIKYGYKIDDKISKESHEKIIKKLDSLKRLFYSNYYIIDHELSHWVELLFVRIKEERSLLPESSESETFISLDCNSSVPGLVLL